VFDLLAYPRVTADHVSRVHENKQSAVYRYATPVLMLCVILSISLTSLNRAASEPTPQPQVTAPVDANGGEGAKNKSVVEGVDAKSSTLPSAQVKSAQEDKPSIAVQEDPSSSKSVPKITETKKPVRKSIKSTRRIITKKQKGKKRRKKRRRFPKNRPKRALKNPPPLGKIPFPLGEQLTFKVNMLNAHSGTVVLKVGRRGKYRGHSVVEVSGFVRSSPFLENFYPIRDSLSVLVDEQTFTPLKSDFFLKEKDRQIEYHSEFHQEKKQIDWKKKRLVKGKERVSKLKYSTPDSIYNVLSSLYALRRLPLAVGLSFEQYVWDGQRERLILVEVIGEEKVLTDMGRFDAYKIKIKGTMTGGIISRRTLKRPPENGFIWIAKDAYRTPLRAVTPTKLGQAEAVLSARAINPE
jgi:hypothetical protein